MVTVVHVRNGEFIGQKNIPFSSLQPITQAELIRQCLIEIYRYLVDIPPLVALPVTIEDQGLISTWLSQQQGYRIELRVPERGEKVDFIALANKNAQSKLESMLLKTEGTDFSSLIGLKELLCLAELPERIEAVDISNLGTSEPVGATVCFINGQPDKNEYRRYKIKTVEGQNDFAMIQEVVTRRFSDTSRPLPDLFVVDGGPEQLRYTFEGIRLAGRSPKMVIALAKKPDRIYLPGRKKPITAPRGSKGLLMLGRIRDEVHRYVIGFHRQRQRKKSLGKP